MFVNQRRIRYLLFVWVGCSVAGEVDAGDAASIAARTWSASIDRSIPALNTKRFHKLFSSFPRTVEASVRAKRKPTVNPVGPGFYYGIPDRVLSPPKKQGSKRRALSTAMDEALEELREMRHEMEALRREMVAMKRRMAGEEEDVEEEAVDRGGSALLARRKRQWEFDRIGMEVEKWAEKLLFEERGEEDGWAEVPCSKFVRNKFNREGNIKCYLKWMKDSRGTHADTDDENEYPCVKVYATIDAPMESVCTYLSEKACIKEYNDLVVDHRDLEEISPHSKICWGKSPQILFIKPRDLVTFCHHRWLRDGTQVIVNQACDHPDIPVEKREKEGKACRAYALRGANFISRDPEDSNKTRFAILAHANPGGGIPHWGMKTAVGVVAPIEPFKFFHRINENVKKMQPQLERTEMVGSTTSGRSAQPAGISQMGYACFWPNGGGLKEGFLHHSHPEHLEPTEEHHHAGHHHQHAGHHEQ